MAEKEPDKWLKIEISAPADLMDAVGNFLTESVKKMNEASEMRRLRLVYAGTGIHPLLYAILIAGSFITIAFTMLFGTENHVEQLIMTSCLAAMIAFALFTIIALDYPFTGTFSIEPDVFIDMLPSLISK